MADNVNTAPEGGEAPKKPGPFENKLVLLGTIVVVQALLAFGLTKFVLVPATSRPQVVQVVDQPEETVQGMLVSLDEMVVTLSSAGRPRYLRTTIALETTDPTGAALVEERKVQFRDIALMALSRHGPEELASYEGKEAVKAEIKEQLVALMGKDALLNVYYSDFVIQ